MAQTIKNLPEMQETWVQSLGQNNAQGTSDFRLRSQGPCRLGTGESGLVLG